MHQFRGRASFLFAALAVAGAIPSVTRATPISISQVFVGDAGNLSDPATGLGAVPTDYRIGTYEVTNLEYTAFLNAVAATDPFQLYNATSMGGTGVQRGGIARNGVSGSYSYTVLPSFGDKPVNHVTWYDAARFTNWLHNNQPVGPQGDGTTETGAYTLLGGTTTPSNGPTVTREPDARWFLPTENEWYKAAYYNPTTASYFTYPTSSNTVPTIATADSVGNVSNPGPNVANYREGADWNGLDGHVTTVGSAGAASPYFTFDQGGNLSEWNETTVTPGTRGIRGGAWNGGPTNLFASVSVFGGNPIGAFNTAGFRVASVVPEPSLLILLPAGTWIMRRSCADREGQGDRKGVTTDFSIKNQ